MRARNPATYSFFLLFGNKTESLMINSRYNVGDFEGLAGDIPLQVYQLSKLSKFKSRLYSISRLLLLSASENSNTMLIYISQLPLILEPVGTLQDRFQLILLTFRSWVSVVLLFYYDDDCRQSICCSCTTVQPRSKCKLIGFPTILESLVLYQLSLSGTIPSEIGSMSALGTWGADMIRRF